MKRAVPGASGARWDVSLPLPGEIGDPMMPDRRFRLTGAEHRYVL